MYVDSIKIGNANARAIRTVVDLEAVPTQVFENSPMLIKVGETLYVKNKVAGNIIGTWHLKDTISYTKNVGVNFDFVSNDTTYTALLWQNSELHYASQATSDVVVYNESGWVNQAYRTIVIKSGENADLLAFLQASAEKLIDGYYYYTEVGGSGGVVIEKYTQDMENFADIVFTADEFNTILNSDSVVVKLNIANIQNIFFAKAMQVADGSNQDIVYLNSYVASAGTNFVLGLVKPHDSTQVAHIVLKQTLPEPPTAINLNDSFPSTATNGTLTSTQLSTLQSSDQNYIIFNNELFRLNDKQSSEGYLVYSHNGHDTTGCFFQKCITITISTLGWVLETQENQAKLTAGSGITIENNVISSTGGGSGGSETPTQTFDIPIDSDGNIALTQEQASAIYNFAGKSYITTTIGDEELTFEVHTAVIGFSTLLFYLTAQIETGITYMLVQNTLITSTPTFETSNLLGLFENCVVVEQPFANAITLQFLALYKNFVINIDDKYFVNNVSVSVDTNGNPVVDVLKVVSDGTFEIITKTLSTQQISVQVNDDDTIDLTIN